MAAALVRSPNPHGNPQQMYSSASQQPSPFPRPSRSPGIAQQNESIRASVALMSLPPKRRAEVLLAEMAGLTGRILELTRGSSTEGRPSVPSLGLTPKGNPGQQFLDKAVVPPEGQRASSAREVLGVLEMHQSLLTEAICELQKLGEVERQREQLAQQMQGADAALRQFAKRLRESQHLLEMTLDDYQEYRPLRRKLNAKSRPQQAGEGASTAGSEGEGRERRDGGAPACERGEGSGVADEGSGLKAGEEDRVGGGIAAVAVKDLVAYAHRISYTTFAPPEFAQGAALVGALPPAPQDEQMRASALYQLTDTELGILKAAAPAKEPEPGPPAPAKEAPPAVKVEPGAPGPAPATGRPPAGAPLAPAAPAGRQVPPPGAAAGLPLPPPPPPGWKPGDPIPLPQELVALPPPPPGWKPGDPIVLPPMPATPAPPPPPAAAAETAGTGPPGAAPADVRTPAQAPRPGPPPAPAFQVQHVELDLNPELEDSDSYYSDSSDEED